MKRLVIVYNNDNLDTQGDLMLRTTGKNSSFPQKARIKRDPFDAILRFIWKNEQENFSTKQLNSSDYLIFLHPARIDILWIILLDFQEKILFHPVHHPLLIIIPALITFFVHDTSRRNFVLVSTAWIFLDVSC